MGHTWLIGMMGSGKSTVGVLVSEILELPFVDTDTEVESAAEATISEIFSRGESVFRSLEASTISSCADGPQSVIATGGGAVLLHENVTHMKRTGHIVHLSVDRDTVESRLKDEGTGLRPLYVRRDDTASSNIDAMLAERTPLYESASSVTIGTVGREPRDIAEEVAAWVGM